MRQTFVLSILLLLSIAASATSSDLTIDVLTYNKSANIKDGYAVVSPNGGHAPFKYYWSDKGTDTTQEQANGLIEGAGYSITVVDNTGASASTDFTIEAETSNEKINYIFHTLVDVTSHILLIDIFAEIGLYDPIIYNENKQPLLYPNGSPKTMSIPFIVVWLVFGAVFFTIKFRLINFRGMRHAIELIQGKYDNPEDKGEITHFQALTTALSATVGLGNIAGVAIAISYGGPGAVFWMIIAGMLGMASKFAEATLGVKFRRINQEGEVSGGPMYYLRYAFGTGKYGKIIGRGLAGLFAILTIGGSFGGGNMFQANQTFSQMKEVFPAVSHMGVYFGIFLAILVGLVIIGGIKSIAKVTSKVVPFMAVIYFIAAFVVIGINIKNFGEVISVIFTGAFDAPAVKGGFIGVLIMGFRRAAFSNEAGIGSAAIAHSAVKTKEPISEGIVALLGPFIDTVIICTITACVLLFSGFYTSELTEGLQGAQITSRAFTSVFPWFDVVLFIAVFLFAFSTLISWSYYGQKAFNYLFGNLSIKWFGSSKVSANIYKLIFLIFIIVGSSSGLGAVIDFSDMMILSMALPNIIGLIAFSPRLKRDLNRYQKKLANGTIKKYS